MARGQSLKARDIMTSSAECVGEDQTLRDAAVMMRDLEVGALPICGQDDRLKGIITDRDIVLRCLAEGRDPDRVRAGDLGGSLHWADAEASVSEVLQMMETHQIRRLPVIDTRRDRRLVGMISESNLARNLSDEQIAEFVGRVAIPH